MRTTEAIVIRKFLENQKAFAVVERGWYHGPDFVEVFSTEDEALKFLGFTKEKNEKEKTIKRTGEYCYRVVEEINLANYFDTILKKERAQECFEKKMEIQKEGNSLIYSRGYRDGYDKARNEIKEVVRKFIKDLPGWTTEYV